MTDKRKEPWYKPEMKEIKKELLTAILNSASNNLIQISIRFKFIQWEVMSLKCQS